MAVHGTLELLVQSSKQELGLDVSILSANSNQKVRVRCKTCDEQFNREYRNLGIPHSCPSHRVSFSGPEKWCNGCRNFLGYNSFAPRDFIFDKLSSVCRDCLERSDTYFREVAAGLVQAAQSNGRECLVDAAQLVSIYEEQKGLCFYSQTPIDFYSDQYSPCVLPLDRSGDLTRHNTILVTRNFNDHLRSSYIRLETKINHDGAVLPFRKRVTDAGYDVSAVAAAVVPPHGTVSIETGLSISPPAGYYYSVEGRSSLWSRGIVPFRGIIDGTYQGELIITLMSSISSPYHIAKGDRIAQLILHKIIHGDFVEVADFSPVEDGRLANGFGSTGK